MFSIRKLSVVLSVPLLWTCVEGCARKTDSAPVVSHEPQEIDAAMQLRQWDQSVAYYPNGDAVAGTTLFSYEPTRERNELNYYYADTGVFFLNLALVPYRLFADPVTATRTYAGETVSPSYTAVPPLPEQAPPVFEPMPDEPATPDEPAMPEAQPSEPMPSDETFTPEQPRTTEPPRAPANPLDIAPAPEAPQPPATQPMQ